MEELQERTENIKILNKQSEEIPFTSLLHGIVNKINDPEGIAHTKGKKAITLMIETLLAQNDPMLTALGVLGGEKTLNAAGLLLFVAFQVGSLVGSGEFTVVSDDETEPTKTQPE